MTRLATWPATPRWLLPSLGLLLALFLTLGDRALSTPPERFGVDAATQARMTEIYGQLPLSFQANEGQTDVQVDFLSRGSGYSLFLLPTEAVLALHKPAPQSHAFDESDPGVALDQTTDDPGAGQSSLRLRLVAANGSPIAVGLEELPGKTNYFIGNDPARWHTNVSSYARVRYRDVYPGIDLIYYGNQRQLEYDFVVSPGADPSIIRLSFDGADEVDLDNKGNLVLHVGGGEVVQHAPIIYQEIDGETRAIPGGYVLDPAPDGQGQFQVGFKIGPYDSSIPLVIDPVLEYSTYLGGSAWDMAFGVAVDSSGSAYVTGLTYSTDFPTASPFQAALAAETNRHDVFVTKLDAAGSELAYSTYLGGSGFDQAVAIAVDSLGNAYVTGHAGSNDFPTAGPFQANKPGLSDSFVTKLNASGSAIVYSTYLGGSGYDYAWGIAVDSSGHAYVTGQTSPFGSSSDFPTVNPFQAQPGGGREAFVTKLNAAGSALIYSTYLGGRNGDYGMGIAVDASGNAHVTGATASDDFPTASPFQPNNGGGGEAFVAKLGPQGSALVYSTYLGGSASDEGWSIAGDLSGNTYVTGSTFSSDFPTTNPFQPTYAGDGDAFVTRLNSSGSALDYSTFLGGSSRDAGTGVAVDASGNAHVTGIATTADFPWVRPLHASSTDDFVAKLNAAGSDLLYSASLRGFGKDIAVDSSGNAYVAGVTASNMLMTASPIQPVLGGGFDAFVAKIADGQAPEPAPTDVLSVSQWALVALAGALAGLLIRRLRRFYQVG